MKTVLKNKGLLVIAVGVIVLLTVGFLLYTSLKDRNHSNTQAIAQPLSHHQLEAVRSELTQLLSDKDPKASLDYLRNATQNDTALARECHPLLHHLGRSAYEKYQDFNKTISYQDGLCNSGYTHGAIEAHFLASKDIQATLKTTCSSTDGNITFQLWQCYHGIGHGVMYFTVKDLPRSIALCESLPSDLARNSCVNGALMERFIIVSHSGAHAKHTSDVTQNLCTQLATTYKPDCYFYAPTAYLERHTNDYTGAFEECTSAESDYIGSCIAGVGGQAMKENVTRPEVSRNICTQAPDKYEEPCISGALSLLINHYGATSPMESHCETTFSAYKTLCTNKVTAWNNSFNS